MFWLQICVSEHILLRTFVHTIACKFAEVWCAKAACHIQTHVHFVGQGINSSNTSRHTSKVSLECSELSVKFFAVEMTVIEAQTTAQGQLINLVRRCGKRTEIKQIIVWNQEFVAKVLIVLYHTIGSDSEFPTIFLWEKIMKIIVHRLEFHI